MSRCRHARGRYVNPYVEFNFESSLRRYGKTGNEMTRRCRHKHGELLSSKWKANSTKSLKGLKKETQQQKDEKQKTQKAVPQILDAQHCEVQPQAEGREIISDHSQNPSIHQPMKPLNQNFELISMEPFFAQNVGQKASENRRESQLFQEDHEFSEENQDDLLKGLGNEHEFQREHQIFDQNSSLSLFSHGPSAMNGQQQGGRFSINDRISISKRRLNKFLIKNQSLDSILDHILKKRSYLANEREEIAKRLENYLLDY